MPPGNRHLGEALGPDHPDVACGYQNLGNLYYEEGRWQGAERLYRRALDILAKHAAESDPRVTQIRTSLVQVYVRQGRLMEAERLQRSVVASLRARVGEQDDAYRRNLETYTLLRAANRGR
ncbi:MAG: tetratricopeptide repeat protein [Bryobacterales bacterium]|nr:tetratricopeptide repeat protein [Bryobacterales bacterium]